MQGFKKGTTGSYAVWYKERRFLERSNDNIGECCTVMIVLYKLLKYVYDDFTLYSINIRYIYGTWFVNYAVSGIILNFLEENNKNLGNLYIMPMVLWNIVKFIFILRYIGFYISILALKLL